MVDHHSFAYMKTFLCFTYLTGLILCDK